MLHIYPLVILLAIAVQAFFTATEMAFTTVSRIKLKSLVQSGDSHAKKLNDFLSKEGVFLGTTLVGTNIAVIVSSTLATRIFAEYFNPAFSPLISTVVMVPLTLLFAEIIPKIVARQFATPFALYAVSGLNGFFKIFRPIILAVTSISKFLLHPFKKYSAPWDATFTKNDLKTLLQSGHEAGEVKKDEFELIHKALDLDAKSVARSMVPLYKVASISENDSTDDLKHMVSLTGFSRVPVYRKSKSDIVGILNIYDVLYSLDKDLSAMSLADFMRETVTLDPEDGLDIALTRLRHKKQPMGIVIDAGGKTVGIITIEDILEELVGNIEDKS